MSDIENPYLLAAYQGRIPKAPKWFGDALAMAPERGHFASQGAQIELLSWGDSGKPGLLFLHGNGAHADWWSAIAPFFADQWRCAAPSLSGMGRSERRADGYTILDFAQEARDAIPAAGLDRAGPPIVIAHSMGGMVGIHALAARRLARGLILIDSPLGMSDDRAQEVRAGAPRTYRAHRPFATLADGLARFRLSPPQACANDYMVDHIARHGLVRQQDGQWVWHFDPQRMAIPDEPVALPIDRVGCPVAYIYGDRSALIDGATLASTLAALPPGSPVVAIPDAAHHVPLDQPLALIAALRALLATWPGG